MTSTFYPKESNDAFYVIDMPYVFKSGCVKLAVSPGIPAAESLLVVAQLSGSRPGNQGQRSHVTLTSLKLFPNTLNMLSASVYMLIQA